MDSLIVTFLQYNLHLNPKASVGNKSEPMNQPCRAESHRKLPLTVYPVSITGEISSTIIQGIRREFGTKLATNSGQGNNAMNTRVQTVEDQHLSPSQTKSSMLYTRDLLMASDYKTNMGIIIFPFRNDYGYFTHLHYLYPQMI